MMKGQRLLEVVSPETAAWIEDIFCVLSLWKVEVDCANDWENFKMKNCAQEVWLTATHVPPSSPDNLAAAGCQVVIVFCSQLSNTVLFKGTWPLKPVHFRYESTSLSFIEYSKIWHSSGRGVLQAQVYGKTDLKLTNEWASNNSWESS